MAARITSYSFGEIVVDGKLYTEDLIILPSKVEGGWWRKEGHTLHIQDLEKVFAEKPEILVVGTGYNGMMRVPQETVKKLEEENIKVIVQTTREAWKTYNKLAEEKKKVAAALHLTC
ncbi:MAG: Mth938-like domain-containing protein [Candidatus Odinarchaeia archaeon]